MHFNILQLQNNMLVNITKCAFWNAQHACNCIGDSYPPSRINFEVNLDNFLSEFNYLWFEYLNNISLDVIF